MYRKIMRIIRAYELSEPILHYVLINNREFCSGQPRELSERCKIARVKLSGLHCNMPQRQTQKNSKVLLKVKCAHWINEIKGTNISFWTFDIVLFQFLV